MKPQDFYIRQKANAGCCIELSNPDGTPSGHWVVIQSVWSDAYTQAITKMKKDVISDLLALSTASSQGVARNLTKMQQRKRKASLVAALIKSWSFSESCTETEKTLFLMTAPRLRRQLERVSETIHGA